MSRQSRLAALGAAALLVAACGSTTPTPSSTTATTALTTVTPSPVPSPSPTASQPPSPAATASASASPAPSPAAPAAFNLADFSAASATVDNPWFPLTPGTTLVYKGIRDDKPSVDTFEVTRETASIAGVTTVVIHDSRAASISHRYRWPASLAEAVPWSHVHSDDRDFDRSRYLVETGAGT